MLIMRNESTTNQQSLSLSVEMFPVEEWKLSDDFADSVQAQDEYFDLHTFNSELLANIEQDYFLKNQSTIEQLYLSTFSLN
ncbi:hypothetical protein [Acinetobacter sp. P1(2025)]|uniref:hypothetical protein n=1 Tax=Acinetobacter sp. P1(2025) TaxID=3446120 RepID=UPI003F533381